jgi:hypothetical protein
MSTELELLMDGEVAAEVRLPEGRRLFRYVYRPDTPGNEAPRPYIPPLCSISGEELTWFRPNDHPWHHALSFTINQLSGHAFWGGPTYRRDEGYQWRSDHGRQVHVAWQLQSAQRLAHTLEWRTGDGRDTLLSEQRVLSVAVLGSDSWSLRWQAVLTNVSGRALDCGNPFSAEGLKGSHYTGLQFRGTRDLLDDHGDAGIRLRCEGEHEGEAAVHGTSANWMEWVGQKDTSLRRVRIRFQNNTGPLHWFVRRHNPLAALPFQYEQNRRLAPGENLEIDHTLTFTDE